MLRFDRSDDAEYPCIARGWSWYFAALAGRVETPTGSSIATLPPPRSLGKPAARRPRTAHEWTMSGRLAARDIPVNRARSHVAPNGRSEQNGDSFRDYGVSVQESEP
jgi:hypothetical protein